MQSHVARDVDTLGYGSTLLVARRPAHQLIVFVHGFNGNALKTWKHFDESDQRCWGESDLLFVGYDSLRENVLSVVHRLSQFLDVIYPRLPDYYSSVFSRAIRAPGQDYRDLLLVGHSLGGVIIRRILAEAVKLWQDKSRPPDYQNLNTPSQLIEQLRPRVLDAKAMLFSPASEGFLPKGWLGVMSAVGVLRLSEIALRKAPSYTELKPHSALLANTKSWTESYCRDYGSQVNALRAQTIWANPDTVVQVEDYSTDRPSTSANGRTHADVCKPDHQYSTPWHFVEQNFGQCP